MFAVFGVTDTVCEERAAKLVADGRKYRSKRLGEDDEPIIYRGGGRDSLGHVRGNEARQAVSGVFQSKRGGAIQAACGAIG